MASSAFEHFRSIPHPSIDKKIARATGAALVGIATLVFGAEIILPQAIEIPQQVAAPIALGALGLELTGVVIFEANKDETGRSPK